MCDYVKAYSGASFLWSLHLYVLLAFRVTSTRVAFAAFEDKISHSSVSFNPFYNG